MSGSLTPDGGSLTPDGSGLNVEGVANSYDHTNDFPVSVEGIEKLCLIFHYGQIELNFSITSFSYTLWLSSSKRINKWSW
jgi:hypothetical protein